MCYNKFIYLFHVICDFIVRNRWNQLEVLEQYCIRRSSFFFAAVFFGLIFYFDNGFISEKIISKISLQSSVSYLKQSSASR
jgi:hypothetical protein